MTEQDHPMILMRWRKHLLIGGSENTLRLVQPQLRAEVKVVYLVYAGRFDPLTHVHAEIIRGLCNFAKHMSDKSEYGVWRVVVWPHPAYGKKGVEVSHEVRASWLTRVFSKEKNSIIRFDDDVRRDGLFTSRARMQDIFKKTELVIPESDDDDRYYIPSTVIHVIGEDNVGQMQTWIGGQYLWNECQWLIVPRPGVGPYTRPPLHAYLPRQFFVPKEQSATDVRRMIAQGTEGWENLLAFLPGEGPSIADDIKRLGLYGYTP